MCGLGCVFLLICFVMLVNLIMIWYGRLGKVGNCLEVRKILRYRL